MINDLISDALTRVRNAGMRRLPVTTLVHSKSCLLYTSDAADE